MKSAESPPVEAPLATIIASLAMQAGHMVPPFDMKTGGLRLS
jgi:hypothetical protein